MIKTASEIAEYVLYKTANQPGYAQQDVLPPVGADGGQQVPTAPRQPTPQYAQTEQQPMAREQYSETQQAGTPQVNQEAELEAVLRQLPPEYIQYLIEQSYQQEQPQQRDQYQQYYKVSASAEEKAMQKKIDTNESLDLANKATRELGVKKPRVERRPTYRTDPKKQ